jgi:DNA-binding transcriptional regulator YiaG
MRDLTRAVEAGKIRLEVVCMGRRKVKYQWDAESIRALRKYMGMTQQQMSEELGTRQQTISEWETGMYRPRGGINRLLTLVAEQVGFEYQALAEGSSSEEGAEEEELGEEEQEPEP